MSSYTAATTTPREGLHSGLGLHLLGPVIQRGPSAPAGGPIGPFTFSKSRLQAPSLTIERAESKSCGFCCNPLQVGEVLVDQPNSGGPLTDGGGDSLD
jgi:hypothetical protein